MYIRKSRASLSDAVSINPEGSADQDKLHAELQTRNLRERHAGWLRKANVRIADGMLFSPSRDSAVFHIRAVLKQDGDNRQARQMLAQVERLAFKRARQSLDAERLDEAEHMLAGLASIKSRKPELPALREELLAAQRRVAEQIRLRQLLAGAATAIEAARLVGPGNDNAQAMLAEVSAADPRFPGLAEVTAQLEEALAPEAEAARLAAEEAEAAAMQALSPDGEPIEVPALARAEAALPNPAQIVPESELERRRFVAPMYPLAAQRKQLEGWVEMQFTVDAEGRPRDILVTGSEPASVFENNAVKALQRWRYEPTERDGQPVEQRTRVRIVFRLPE